MLPPFDIFRAEPDRQVLWLEAAPDLVHARERVQAWIAETPAEYIILSQQTGNKIVLNQSNIDASRKHRILQIAYVDKLMQARATILQARSHAVTSVLGNDEARAALQENADYDMVLLGHAAPQKVRTEMANWIKARFPGLILVSLNPPAGPQLPGADFNLIFNGPEEWLMVLETT